MPGKPAKPRSSPESKDSFPEWLLAWAGGDEPGARIRDFRRFLLLYGAARSWLWFALATPLASQQAALLLPAAVWMSVAAGLSFSGRSEALAARVALPAVLFQVAWRFPFTANHLFLELVCVAVLALVRRGDRRDEAHALSALRLTTALILFHTGLQKVFYGHYFRGDFLAFMVGVEDRFGRAFGWLLSPAEVERLSGFDRRRTGAGPYRIENLAFVLGSNAVWLAELSLPALLVLRRSRVLSVLGALGLMLGIQVAALELGFALLFVNLLLLFLPGRWNARLLPVAAALWVWALAAAAGLLPGDPAAWNLL